MFKKLQPYTPWISWKLCWLILLGISSFSPINGQVEPNYEFRRITIEDGLSQSSVNALAQDQEGFIWVATQDGLNRYDGLEFEVMRKKPYDDQSISGNFLTSLLVDRSNRLWVGTIAQGLNLYQRETKTFLHLIAQCPEPNAISDNRIRTLYEDNKGNIWVVTAKGIEGLRERKLENGQSQFSFQSYLQVNENESDQRPLYISTLYHDQQDRLWVGTSRGLLCFSYTTHSTIDAPAVQSDNLNYLLPGRIVSIEEDVNQQLWVSTTDRIYRYDEKSFQLMDDYCQGIDISKNAQNYLFKNKKGHLLMTSGNSIYELPLKNGQYASKFELFRQLNIPCSIANLHGRQAFIEDSIHEDLYWFGTDIGGVLQLYKRRKQFHSNYLHDIRKSNKRMPIVWNILTDSSDYIWMRVEEGFAHYNPQADAYQYWSRFKDQDGNWRESWMINSIYLDQRQQLWGGGMTGFYQFSKNKRGQLLGKKHPMAEACEKASVHAFREIGQYLLMGTNSGILIYDQEQGKLVQDCPIYLDEEPGSRVGSRVSYIYLDRQHTLWVGTTGGLAVYKNVRQLPDDLLNQKPQFYFTEKGQPNSLIDNNIQCIIQDNKDQIWLATGTGLALVQQKNQQLRFQSYSEKDGLANNMVYGMLSEDDGRHFWLSTNNGLSRFDTQSKLFCNYDISDGLQNNEFNGRAYFKNDQGELFFGGISGYTKFYPDQIQQEASTPPIWITDIKTNTGDRFRIDPTKNHQSLCLDYDQRSVAIRFVGIDYLKPKGLSYFYDLKGAGLKNVPIGNNRELIFSNLAPGNYQLRIKVANKDGFLNEEGAQLNLIVNSPFWKSPWFYLIITSFVLLIIGLVLWLIYRFKLSKIAEIESIRQLAAQDFHDELGSKLSIISLYSELSKSNISDQNNLAKNHLNKVITTSNSLYDSMKDLLWSLSPEKDSVGDLYLHLKDFGEELFNHSSIDFKTSGLESSKETAALPMNYKRHVLLIGKEAMNNCLRHAKCQGVELAMTYKNNVLVMEIKDNGVGFKSKEQKAGDGLQNMHSRARKIKAKLLINSSKNGTNVTLNCPF